jgi:Fuc2NAc and GlcNAc transferase
VLVPAAAVALLGLVDDRIGLSARLRLVVQFACALALVGATAIYLDLEPRIATLAWLPVLAVGVVWCTNFYNFMDGIDGIAGSQGVFVAAGAGLLLLGPGSDGIALLPWVVAGACAGFLVWNWSPASIFMGDVGSASLGFLFAALAVFTALSGRLSEWTWLLLLGAFAVDATVTLLVRWRSGQRLTEAHRSHAYQVMARRSGSHARTVLVFAAVNLCWLLPFAFASARAPQWGAALALVALLPLCILALKAGAGRGGDA